MWRRAVVLAAAIAAVGAGGGGLSAPRAIFATADSVTRLSDAALRRLASGAASSPANATSIQARLMHLAAEAEPLAAAAEAVVTNSKLAGILTSVCVGRTGEIGPLKLLVGVDGGSVSKPRARRLQKTLAALHSLSLSLLVVQRESPATPSVTEGGE